MDLGLAEPRNVGITAVQVRPQPLEHGKVEAFLEIQGAPVGSEPYETQIEVQRQGELVLLQRISVAVGGVERLLLPIDSSQGDEVTVKVSTEGDVLASDDVVHLRLPEARPIRVAWVTEGGDPFTQLALAAIQESGQLEVFQVPPSSWPLPDEADGRPPFEAVIFDAWLPEVWDPKLQAIVIDPPRPLGPIRTARLETGIPLGSLRSVAEGHPLLYGVASGRVAVFQTCVLDAGGGSDAPLGRPGWASPQRGRGPRPAPDRDGLQHDSLRAPGLPRELAPLARATRSCGWRSPVRTSARAATSRPARSSSSRLEPA